MSEKIIKNNMTADIQFVFVVDVQWCYSHDIDIFCT